MTRTTDPNTLVQLLLRNQQGGVGQRTVSEQFRGIYDATVYSVDAESGTCMVTVPAYSAQVPLGPSPYFGGPPEVGSACIVGFIIPATGAQGEIGLRVLADDGAGNAPLAIDGGNALGD